MADAPEAAVTVYGQSASTPETRLAFLDSQLRIIAVSAQQARQRGDTADLQGIISMFRKVMADAAALRAQVNQAEQPSAFLVSLDHFSDSAIAVGKQLGVDVGNVAGGIASTAKVLPLLLLAGLGVLGVGLYKGSISVRR